MDNTNKNKCTPKHGFGNSATDIYLELLINEEQKRATARENEVENTSANKLAIRQDKSTGIVTIQLLNIHGNVLDTKELDLDTEKIILNIELDYSNKKLIFTLVDGTTIETDISSMIDDIDSRIVNIENKLTTYFDKFVDGENIDTQFVDGETVYCYSGQSIEGGGVPSSLIISIPQTTKKAIYVKNIYIKYTNKSNEEVEYSYTFESKQFDTVGQTRNLGDLSWILNNNDTDIYFGYSSSYGQQIGSGSKPAYNLSLTTNDLAGCTVTDVKLYVCGASSNDGFVSITVGNDAWKYHEGQEDETTEVELPVNDVNDYLEFTYGSGSQPGEGTIIYYSETFLEKNNESLVTIAPKEDILYVNKDDDRIYSFDGSTLIEVSKVLELGFTSTTAYRGDYGQENYNKLTEVREQDFTFTGVKTFADDIYVGDIRSNNEDGGYSYLSKWHQDAFYWELHNIGWIGYSGVYHNVTFMQSEDIDAPGEIVSPSVSDCYRIMNLADPINDRDGVNKQYVDNGLSTKADITYVDNAIDKLNIGNGEGNGSVCQKNAIYDGESIEFSDGTPGTQNGDSIPGGDAKGIQSYALGGLRYDCVNEEENNFDRTTTSVDGNQSMAVGGSVHVNGD